MKENKNYIGYVRKVFSYFEGCKQGEGLFLYRTLNAERKKYTAQDYYNKILLTIYNLVDQGYLTYKNGDFTVLSQDGYDYMQGGEMPYNKVNFNYLVGLSDNSLSRFDQLWQLIGSEDTALFYVPGPCFFNTIKPYLKNVHGSYSDYMEELKAKELSTSRIKWYRILYTQLSDEESELFLGDLSLAVEHIYNGTDIPQTNEESNEEEKAMTFGDGLLASIATSDTTNVSPKKKVFISYCWEDDEHKKWVHKLAEDLKSDFDVKIDVEQPIGTDLNQFMESMINSCDKVLIIVTPEYKDRADDRLKGVGYETTLITNKLISNQNEIKFIPIIRKGSKEESYPSYIGNRKGLDMKDNSKYDDALKLLVDNLKKY